MRERIKEQSSLIIQYYIVILLFSLLFHKLIIQHLQTETIISVVLAIYFLFFPIVFLYAKKYALQIFLFCLAFMTGFYSFYQYSIESHSILNAFYFTFQLFILVTTDVFTTDGSSMLQYPFFLEIARWAAALYTISTLFIAVYRMLEMSILQEFYQIRGGHYVVIGYNENTIELMTDLRRRKKRIILIADNISPEHIERLEDEKIVVLVCSMSQTDIYTRCGLLRAKSVVLFHEQDLENLNELLDIKEYIHTNKPKLSVFIHLKSEKSVELLTQLTDNLQRKGEVFPFQLEVRNMYQLFAKRLLDEHHLLRKSEVSSTEETPHFLFIGFGLMGQNLALEANEQSIGQYNRPLLMTALDKNMQTQQSKWAQLTEGKETHISLQKFDIETDDIDQFLNTDKLPVTHLFICLHEEYLDFTEGIELSNRYPNLSIYMQMTKGGILDKWLELGVTKTNTLYSSGVFQDVLTEELFLSRETESR